MKSSVCVLASAKQSLCDHTYGKEPIPRHWLEKMPGRKMEKVLDNSVIV